MSALIDLGCKVADVHHRYHEIHGAMFGTASFRLVLDALRGRRRRAYSGYSQTLTDLRHELAGLDPELADLISRGASKATEREVQQVLAAYAKALDRAIEGLIVIFDRLEQDESGYRDTGADGRSDFTQDKLRYDHSLLELERLGTRLNRLFANY